MLTGAMKSWNWIRRVPGVLTRDSRDTLRRLRLSHRILWATTKVEFAKRYAGSALGMLWYPLYSALLLGMYCFVYMVIFRQRLADYGHYSFVLFIFSGLIPYLGFSDAIATSTTSIKANISLVKNTVFPIELIPLRHLLVSIAGLTISLAIVVLMILPSPLVGWHLLYLPVSIALLALFTLPLAWIISGLAALIPDIAYTVNLTLLLFMFLSPIGFSLDQVPDSARIVVLSNPLSYLVESFRFALIGIRSLPLWTDLVFGLFCLAGVVFSLSVFRRLMPLFSDHE